MESSNLMDMIRNAEVPVQGTPDDDFDMEPELSDAEMDELMEDDTSGKNSKKGSSKSNDSVKADPPDPYLVEMHEKSINNADALSGNPHSPCGCFSCKRIFPESKVRVKGRGKKRTLICPYCGEPAVLPGVAGPGVLWRLWAYYYALGKREN